MITAHLLLLPANPEPVPQEFSEQRALGRLIAAAVINQNFCHLLLVDPAEALRQGFNGEKFGLSQRTQDLVKSIQASTLPEFASALERASLSTPLPTGPLSFGQYQDIYLTAVEGMIPTQ